MHTEKFYYGAAYYDEYMPYDRIDIDMQMMKKAGMNVIRIAESTWSTLEPYEGVFDFTSLDRMLDAAAKYDIEVIVGTPTYAIPTWLVKKSEDILCLTRTHQELYGHRQNMDLTNPVYLEHADKVIHALMEHIKDVPHIIGFQIDNETHHYQTYGKRAQQQFQSYIKEQFENIDTFNQEFGLDYWSNRINDWDDFPDVRGTINGSLAAEYEKFLRHLVTQFFKRQADIINQYRRCDQFITHNFDYEWHGTSFGLQPQTNQWDACQYLDVPGCDIYHPSQSMLTGAEINICGNIIRGLKRDNYLVLETQAQGNTSWLPYPGQLRLCAYSHLANGANSVLYWHWHSIHNALESYWKGVLSHDFSENATYLEACTFGKEMELYGNSLINLNKKNRIAVLLSHEALTGLTEFPIDDLAETTYNTVVRLLADALYRCNLEYDIIYPQNMNLASYDLIFVPALYSASEKTLTALHDYVKAGGTLAVTFKSGFSNEHIKIYHDTQPHILNQCLGIHYDQFTNPQNVSLASNLSNVNGCHIDKWMELVTCDSATPIATYDHYAYKQYAAITENSYEKGKAFYIGCMFDGIAMDELVSHIAKEAGIKISPFSFPIIEKCGTNDQNQVVHYFFNYADTPASIPYPYEKGICLMKKGPNEKKQTIEKNQAMLIAPWDLQIVIAQE